MLLWGNLAPLFVKADTYLAYTIGVGHLRKGQKVSIHESFVACVDADDRDSPHVIVPFNEMVKP